MTDRVVRHARVSWLTNPPGGTARVGVRSRAFTALPVSLQRSDPVPHEATPGELLAVAHGMFMAVALSEELKLAGSPAHEIVVEVASSFTGPLSERALSSLDLCVAGRVPGLDAPRFERTANHARARALRAAGTRDDLPGTVAALLEGAR